MDLSRLIYGLMWANKATWILSSKVIGKQFFLVTLLLFTFTLTGCVTLPDPETSQDFTNNRVTSISPGQTAGQTFMVRRARLNGIDLWLQTDQPGNLINIELFHNIEDTSPVFSGSFNSRDGKTHIEIPPLADPPNQSYYLRLSSTVGEVNLLGRNEDNYVKGTAHIDDQPIEADLAFRTTYEYDGGAAISDLRGLLSLWFLILPLGIVLILPGWLLLDFSHLKEKFDWGERVAISLGLSLSFIPLLMLWTALVGLDWGTISLWVVSFILISLLVWKIFKRQPAIDRHSRSNLHTPHFNFRPHASSLILASIFAMTLFTRFAMVRDLAAPPWVDSVHHGLITRLILESGGLPDTYAPYLPPEADYYHFGFHSALATFTWLTDLEIQNSMLIFGQVLNALMIFAVYLLAKTLTNNRPTALAAALISGLFTLMPAYYVSWGRYTQLTGLLILPAAFAVFVLISKSTTISPLKNKSLWLLATFLFAGLFLVHYRVLAFLSTVILAYVLTQISPRKWLKTIGQLLLLGLVSALALLPWLPGAIANLLLPKGLAWTGGSASFSKIPWNFLKPALGETALIVAGIGILLGIILLKRFTLTTLLWSGLLYLLANMAMLRIPGSGFVNPVSVDITWFMPISVLGGFAIGGILEIMDKLIPERWRGIPKIGFVALGFAAAILGAQHLLPTLNPITFLARKADFPAIRWIDENIPAGETILINASAWGYGLYMGNDGGYWISALSNHPTIPPPVLYGLGKSDTISQYNQLIEGVQSEGEDAPSLWELVQNENINYVFIGVRGGVISPQALVESELFEVRYQQDGTWVFEVVGNNH